MTLEQLIAYAESKNGAEASLPFGEDTLVYKVNGKIFLLVSLNATPSKFNAKCDPERAIQLREEHGSILPGYHMNKKHWNTVVLDSRLPNTLVAELIDHSYDLVAGKRSK